MVDGGAPGSGGCALALDSCDKPALKAGDDLARSRTGNL